MARRNKQDALERLPPSPDNLTLTKQDVVRRELETAIRLFFNGGDPVSIHVLASAAAAIMHALAQTNSKPTMGRLLEESLKPQHRDAVLALKGEAYNFMKHGAKDPAATLERFNPAANENLLMFSWLDYRTVFNGDTFFALDVFGSYIMAVRPDLFDTTGTLARASQALRPFARGRRIDKSAAARALVEHDELIHAGAIEGEYPALRPAG